MAEPRKVFDLTETRRVPPQAVDVEQAVLGGILIDYKEGFPIVSDILQTEDFYKPAHQTIYTAMRELYDAGDVVDLLTLMEKLKRKGKLEAVGTEVYLTELTSKITSTEPLEYLSRVVYEKSLARRVIAAATDMLTGAYSETQDVLELVGETEKRVFALSEFRVKQSAVSLSESTGKTVENLQSIHGHKTGVVGVPSGYHAIDSMTGGFRDGHLIIIGGRPSQGKSALVLGMAKHAAIKTGTRVGFFSLEMTTEELIQRLISDEASVNIHSLRTGRAPDADFERAREVSAKVKALPIWIDDTPYQGVSDLRAKSRRLKHEQGINLVVVDYLQLMRGEKGSQSREQEISGISRGLKALAKELKVPVIALCQLNRTVETRTDKRPVLADLRESGAIEQDADEVIFVHRPEMYGQKKIGDESTEGLAEIVIAKQRMGPTGVPRLSFVKEFARFENWHGSKKVEPEAEKESLPF